MLTRFIICAICLLVVVPSVYPRCAAADVFQFRTGVRIDGRISERWMLMADEEYRNSTGDVGPYWHTAFGFNFTVFKELFDVGAYYRFSYERREGAWQKENRPYADAKVQWRVGEWPFYNRLRFEYRRRDADENMWYLRNRIQVAAPKLTSIELQPYVADEIFIDMEHATFARNRIYGGLSLKVISHFSVDVHYFWERLKDHAEWDTRHVASLKFMVAF